MPFKAADNPDRFARRIEQAAKDLEKRGALKKPENIQPAGKSHSSDASHAPNLDR